MAQAQCLAEAPVVGISADKRRWEMGEGLASRRDSGLRWLGGWRRRLPPRAAAVSLVVVGSVLICVISTTGPAGCHVLGAMCWVRPWESLEIRSDRLHGIKKAAAFEIVQP